MKRVRANSGFQVRRGLVLGSQLKTYAILILSHLGQLTCLKGRLEKVSKLTDIASASHLRTRGLSPLLADAPTCVLTFVATAISSRSPLAVFYIRYKLGSKYKCLAARILVKYRSSWVSLSWLRLRQPANLSVSRLPVRLING